MRLSVFLNYYFYKNMQIAMVRVIFVSIIGFAQLPRRRRRCRCPPGFSLSLPPRRFFFLLTGHHHQVSMFFAYFNGYSGLGFYATLLDTFFNAAWTSWPVLLSTPQDRVIEKETIYANPTVYQHAVKGSEFNLRTFGSIMVLAIFHAAVNFFVPAYALDFPAGEHEATPGERDAVGCRLGPFLSCCVGLPFCPLLPVVPLPRT
jgi:hypothetical protein